MGTFADEVASDIKMKPRFWAELSCLRAAGIRETLDIKSTSKQSSNAFDLEVLARLMSSATVFAQADDSGSRDLAQQIAIFGSLATTDTLVREAALRILADLGNFPGFSKIEALKNSTIDLQFRDISFQSHLSNGLLASLNSVEISGKLLPLTEFQFEVWRDLKEHRSIAISAPTSAGKSFVILEHLCLQALERKKFVALYIAPTRALLAEVQGKLEKRLAGEANNLRVTTIPVPDALQRPKQIYVLTQERAQLLLSAVDLQNDVDLVIVDEAQSIGDESRGMILQDCLDRIRSLNQKARFLFLAPGVTGFDVISDSVGLPSLVLHDTAISPVVQNRISVSFESNDEHILKLALVTERGREVIGRYEFDRGFALKQEARLSAVALELGVGGSSLVYATGAAKAEKLAQVLASNLEKKEDKEIDELARFIEQHVHKSYSLAKYVRHGVAFHYGNMPSLLRESIEDAFRAGRLPFLCCTTTLFQGVNLPARNVFMDTPTRGNKKEPLDEASLWNFAGRAGRLGVEVTGNVFLVDYENWGSEPFTKRQPVPLRLAFKDALDIEFDSIVKVLDGAASGVSTISNDISLSARSAAGLSLLRFSKGTLDRLISGSNSKLSELQKESLAHSANEAMNALKLPPSVLETNWVVDPLGLSLMLNRFREGIKSGKLEELISINPSGDSYSVYTEIFFRMYKYLGGIDLSGDAGRRQRGYINHVTVSALKWMRGEPLSQLVSEQIKWAKKANPTKSSPEENQKLIDRSIRETFALVEETLRFKLVQWAKAYVDLLKFAFIEAGYEEHAKAVYDFSLALELGVSNTTGRSLVELGVSRISASAVSSLVADSSLTVKQLQDWLHSRPQELLQLSAIVRKELEDKGLLRVDA